MPALNGHTVEALKTLHHYWTEIAPESPWRNEALAEINTALLENKTPFTDEQWVAYFDLLHGPEGCDFQDDPERGFTWKCKSGNDKSKSEAILTSMGVSAADIERIHMLVNIFGGHCDCEILFNAAEKIVPAYGGEEDDEED